MNALEVTANLFNTASVLLAVRNSIHTWWTGILGCSLFGCLFWQDHLYANASLQIAFIVGSIIGWGYWLPGKHGQDAPIISLPLGLKLISYGTALIVTFVVYHYLHRYTDDVAPLADAAVIVFSLVAQMLLMLRCRDTWVFWFIVNSIAIVLLISRQFYLTAGLYGLFWFNTILGFKRWKPIVT